MKLATTITLAVATFGLGLYAYLDHSGTLKQFFGERPAPLFEGPAVPAITSLTIADPSKTRTLEKRVGRWMLTSPVEDAVDPDWIETIMETFGSMHPKEFLRDDSGSQREGYGLTPERSIALTVGFAQGEPIVYQIGDPGPFEKSAYLFPGGADVYEGAFVVAGDFRKIVDKPVIEMVDPILARFAIERITGLTFQHRNETVSLSRNATPGSRWRLEEPNKFQADDDIVDSLLSGLSTITGTSGALPAEEEVPVEPSHTVRIADVAPENAFELNFFPHPTDDSLLKVRHSKRPLTYDVPKTVLDGFPIDAKALRERRLLRVLAADVSKVTLTRRGREAPLGVENEGAWLMPGPEGAVLVNQEEGDRFLALFNETEVDLYLESGPDNDALYGLDDPAFTVMFEGENLGPAQGESCLLRVGMPPSSPQVFVSVEGMDAIAAVDRTFLTGLAHSSEPLNWKSLEILNVPFDRIREVTLGLNGKPPLQVEVDFKAELQEERLRVLRDGQDRTADMDKHVAAQLIFSLGAFNADGWLPDAQEAKAVLATSSLVVTVKSEPATKGEGDQEYETATLRFAPISLNASAFYYGIRDGKDNEVFLITGEIYQRLSGKKILLEIE